MEEEGARKCQMKPKPKRKCQKKPKPKQQRRRKPEALGEQEVRKGAPGGASSGTRKRHSKAMRAPRRHVRREVGIGMRLPADNDEIAGEVAEQDVVLDLRVLCGTSHAEAHVPVRGSIKRSLCGLNQ